MGEEVEELTALEANSDVAMFVASACQLETMPEWDNTALLESQPEHR
jgi:hypothetical protein